jgi:hypothetical protein
LPEDRRRPAWTHDGARAFAESLEVRDTQGVEEEEEKDLVNELNKN